ncbi:hypothetical protein QBC46DRAFT_440513 [Diplogelasinospora grovesii]|uniref:Uncharacterized protein n=1 Tax=Diplogelasinospora grovesii TaxID=303347 RepID=A0AAN6N654_9PEZI|nr:hypothetical protein QBC46DRAFT_440513 [Diplogelasinospora grovesii]
MSFVSNKRAAFLFSTHLALDLGSSLKNMAVRLTHAFCFSLDLYLKTCRRRGMLNFQDDLKWSGAVACLLYPFFELVNELMDMLRKELGEDFKEVSGVGTVITVEVIDSHCEHCGERRRPHGKATLVSSNRLGWSVAVELPNFTPPSPDALTPCSYRRLFGDALSALKDKYSACEVYLTLYRNRPKPALVIKCARTAHTDEQRAQAGTMICNVFLNKEGKPDFFMDIVWARLYDHGQYEQYALEKIRDLLRGEGLLDKDDQGDSYLKQLPRRGPAIGMPAYGVDVPSYCYLSYALFRFNEGTKDKFKFEKDVLLCQFLEQQPAFRQREFDPAGVSYVQSCLLWCMDVLGRKPAVLKAIQDLPNPDKDTITFQILCTLCELLATVVYMIMDNSARNDGTTGLIVERAFARAQALYAEALNENVDRLKDLFIDFLDKACERQNPQRISAAHDTKMTKLQPFRDFVANYLRLELPETVNQWSAVSTLAPAAHASRQSPCRRR